MKFRFAASLLLVSVAAACARSTQPVAVEVDQAALDAVSPTNLSFNATSGLPTEPFNTATPTSAAPSNATNTTAATAPGAPFPDSLKLTTEQKTKISALRSTFETANRADILALKDIYEKASAAKKDGKPAADIRAILNLAKPILARMNARFAQLTKDIEAVLTAAQKAWIAARKPVAPPVGWVGPVGPATPIATGTTTTSTGTTTKP